MPALLKTKKEESPSSWPPLEIYSASGVRLASIPWKNCSVVHLGWTTSEDLLCIQEDGSVLIYSLFCEFKRRFSMGNSSKNEWQSNPKPLCGGLGMCGLG
ncbi:vacuolar protein sorting-associated protein 16 homolog isoform X2 [Rhineura floridana]|uniref:vacuolar protein sorting-associated protein 16 homolog isoform X2 n=1 Tax=Rhineura floridana TaxID=261503 RepID=UPI002AC801B9|nr:vacuolar protein sorting-associated protein 16 homolog isoform X2 [Rhineura floridana]